MKYYISNPELDAQISEIRRKIRLSMNGIVSEQMKHMGALYKMNYGVSIPRIKEIASQYQLNHDLAQRLWTLQIRETMIMATLLQPIDKFTPEIAQNWIRGFNQIEIVEQTCHNLLSKLPFSDDLCMYLTESEDIWQQITGFILAARIYKNLTIEKTRLIIQRGLNLSETEQFHLYRALGLCLSRFCRKDRITATYINETIAFFEEKGTIGQQYILSEVKHEILFLEIL